MGFSLTYLAKLMLPRRAMENSIRTLNRPIYPKKFIASIITDDILSHFYFLQSMTIKKSICGAFNRFVFTVIVCGLVKARLSVGPKLFRN